ncbi:unnamed protein product [Orchesella dallaii]|uniref:Copper transport protein n=1 Tax=Orchesella dallaii TaxID=48710 RepID=A0ABP1S4P8_9HEXA
MDHSAHNHHGHGDHSGHSMGMGASSMNQTTTVPPVHDHVHDHSQHSGHGDHSGMDMDMDHGGVHSMGHHSMFFHGGVDETILFEFWKISETGGLIISMIVIFFLAFAYEGLKFYREHLYRHSFQTVQLSTVAMPVENGTVQETHKTVQVKVFSAIHGWQTVLHIIQMVVSYFLMLIFMTYNVWLCVAVALGAGAGYFCFGWKKSVVVDVTEHCH